MGLFGITVTDYTYNKFNPKSCDFDVPDFMNKFVSKSQEHSSSLEYLISCIDSIESIDCYNLNRTPELKRIEVYMKGSDTPIVLKDTGLEEKLSSFIHKIYVSF